MNQEGKKLNEIKKNFKKILKNKRINFDNYLKMILKLNLYQILKVFK